MNADGDAGGRPAADGDDGEAGSGPPSDGGGDDGDGGATDGDGDGGIGRSAGENEGGGARETSRTERVVMVASTLFTVALFGFAIWNAVVAPGVAPPEATVVGHVTVADGGELYEVRVRNPGGVGLVTVTVTVECTDPPTDLVFTNVPAGGHRRGTVRCPPGTTDPSVSVATWIRE